MDKPWKVIFAFVGVFIAGAVFGGLFTFRIGDHLLQKQGRPMGGRGALAPGQQPMQRPLLGGSQPVQPAQLLRRYAERLELTTEQKERIRPLVQRAAMDIRRQQQNHFRESGVILQRLQRDIADELTPEQRSTLRKMEQRQREITSEHRARFGERSLQEKEANRDGIRPLPKRGGPLRREVPLPPPGGEPKQ